MDLTEKNRAKFPSLWNKIFDMLEHKSIKLNGTNALKYHSLYSSDIDLYEKLNLNDFDDYFKDYLTIVKEIKSKKILVFDELKIGDTKFKKIQDIPTNKEDVLQLMMKGSKKMIKFDFITEFKYYIECSMIYDFTDTTKTDVEESIIKDIYKYINNKNLYKAMKRIRTLSGIKNNRDVNKGLNKLLLNPVMGNLYLIISRINAYDKMKGKKPNHKVLEYIKDDLRKVGIKYNRSHSKLIRAVQNKLNRLIEAYLSN